MSHKILFLHGAGGGAYAEDKLLADRFSKELGADYTVTYPELPNEDDPSYDEWKDHIVKTLADTDGSVIVVGHSIGASVALKAFGEIDTKNVAGLFLLAAPFWGGDGWRYDGYEELQLPQDIAAKLPANVPVFMYHCKDDEIVPFSHLGLHAAVLPSATTRSLDTGGHQFGDTIAPIVKDIKTI